MQVNANQNNLGMARLGLAVSRKNVKHAIKRNRIKRIIRESFRKNQTLFEGMDIVVTVQRQATAAGSKILNESLSNHWQQIARCKNY